jgi:hypothetical protein
MHKAVIHGLDKIVKLLQQKGAVLYKSKFKGHYYKIFMRSLSWTDADKKCRALGGYLASVENEEENNFLTDLAGGLFVWIGGLKDKKSNLWKWSNGSPFKYTKWQMGQPDNYGDDENYIALCPDGGWNDLPVDPRRFALQDIIIKGFICEWDRHPRKIMGK